MLRRDVPPSARQSFEPLDLTARYFDLMLLGLVMS